MCKPGGAAFRCATYRAEVMRQAQQELAAATYSGSPNAPELAIAARQATISYAATRSGKADITNRWRQATGETRDYLEGLLFAANELAEEERKERDSLTQPTEPDKGQPLPPLGVKEGKRWKLVSEDFANDPHLVDQWRRNGFDPDTAAQWQTHKIAPTEAVVWAKNRFGVGDAATWRNAGFTPDEAVAWARNSVDPTTAAQWKALNFTAEEAEEWLDTGVDDEEEAARCRRLNITPQDRADEQRAEDLRLAEYHRRIYR